ncbi:MAG: helix-turn-helix domain-containing protein [Coriobacteriales bacterium]|jgi:sugar diacid utilization regulator|nr:helix-turn-helix domain-containing protein [Coriobacteriales bacterium]
MPYNTRMELNLHIIAEDLAVAGHAVVRRIREDASVRRLRFPALFDGEDTKRSLLYIVEAGLLTPENLTHITEDTSLLVIGETPAALKKLPVNLIQLPSHTQLSKLFSEVTDLFGTYELWDNALKHALIAKRHLRRLGEVSSAIFKRPIYLVDSYLQMVFAVVDTDLYELPEGYRYPVIDNNNPSLAAYALDRFQPDTYTQREPFLLPEVYGYRTLSQNVFIDGHLVATVSVDEVGGSSSRAFTERDFALIAVFAEYLVSGMTYLEEWNSSAPRLVSEQMQLLLDGKLSTSEDTDAALKMMAWLVDDAYYCIVAVPRSNVYPSGLLAATAKHVSAQLSHAVYLIHKGRMVFAVNADHTKLSREETVELLVHALAKLEVHIGVSNIFNSFWMLGAQYHLALAAQELGAQETEAREMVGQGDVSPVPRTRELGDAASRPTPDPPAPRVHFFEEHFLDYLILKCKEATPLEAVIPRGVVQLKRYDEKYGTDYVQTLWVYLRHALRVAPAARELFLHRNTLTHKVAQIKFITRLDFENDPEVRLRTLIALRMMGC